MRRRCVYCNKLYRPDPRQKCKQKTCGSGDCQRKRKRDNAREWRKKNPGYDTKRYRETRQPDRREWKRRYWASHPEYRRHHAEYMQIWRKMKRIPEHRVRIPYRDIELTYDKQSINLEIRSVRVPYRVIESILLNTKENGIVLRL